MSDNTSFDWKSAGLLALGCVIAYSVNKTMVLLNTMEQQEQETSRMISELKEQQSTNKDSNKDEN